MTGAKKTRPMRAITNQNKASVPQKDGQRPKGNPSSSKLALALKAEGAGRVSALAAGAAEVVSEKASTPVVSVAAEAARCCPPADCEKFTVAGRGVCLCCWAAAPAVTVAAKATANRPDFKMFILLFCFVAQSA